MSEGAELSVKVFAFDLEGIPVQECFAEESPKPWPVLDVRCVKVEVAATGALGEIVHALGDLELRRVGGFGGVNGWREDEGKGRAGAEGGDVIIENGAELVGAKDLHVSEENGLDH